MGGWVNGWIHGQVGGVADKDASAIEDRFGLMWDGGVGRFCPSSSAPGFRKVACTHLLMAPCRLPAVFSAAGPVGRVLVPKSSQFQLDLKGGQCFQTTSAGPWLLLSA